MNVNADLLFQTGQDIGSVLKAPREIFFYGSGTYATDAFKLTGNATGARTITFPDANFTVIGGAIDNTSELYLSWGYGLFLGPTASSRATKFMQNSGATPTGAFVYTDGDSNSVRFVDRDNNGNGVANGFCGTAACATSATVSVHSSTSNNTTDFTQMNTSGYHGGCRVTLTDNTATAIFHTVAISAGVTYSGGGTVCVHVKDAANETQAGCGHITWNGFNGNTGGVACSIAQDTGGILGALAASSGTAVTATPLTATAATGCTFKLTIDTTLTATEFYAVVQTNQMTGAAEIICQ